MNTFLITVLSIVTLAALVTSAIYLFGQTAQRHQGAKSFSLPVEASATTFDRMLAPLVAEHQDESGLHLLDDNLAAFQLRWLSAQCAERSLDLQYYYWKDDFTGRLLLSEVIGAADRGARVRILLDDINAFGFDPTYLALDSHRNIEVRLFNPSRSRMSSFRRGIELVLKYFTATRRMHNKCWIADGRLVLAGGRNIGDAYFDAARTSNFRDIDIALVGPAVASAEGVFDGYWNSEAALPIRTLHKIRRPKLSKLRFRLAAIRASDAAAAYLRLAQCDGKQLALERLEPLFWTQQVEILADPPEKASGKRSEAWIGRRLDALAMKAEKTLQIVSPYFIPGRAGAKTLLGLAEKGVAITVLTNTLAATDVIAVHGAYTRYRKILVRSPISIYELKAEHGRRRASLFGSRTASLHTKAFMIDGKIGFVGSFNLDPRSRSINTEMGILFQHPSLLQHMLSLFQSQIGPDSSYKLQWSGGSMFWLGEKDGMVQTMRSEPDAPLRRILPAIVFSWLPIESQL